MVASRVLGAPSGNMSEAEPKHTLAAIVFADVVGYSRLMGQDDAGTVARLRRRRAEIVDPLVAGFGGRIVNAAGDSLLMEFTSVVAATRFAVRLQQMSAEADAREAEPLRFRIGVNLGDVLVGHGAVYGDSVNVAARLESLAEPGGLCLSAAAYEQVRGKIEAEFVDRGPQQVKNIARPVGVYALSAAAVAAAPRYAPPSPRASRKRVAVAAALVLALAAGGFVWWMHARPAADFPAELDHALSATQAKLGADARAKLISDYVALRPHKAFAIAPAARNHWWSGDWPSADVAREKVLERCEIAFGETCSLTALDESRVEAPASPTARVSYQGRFALDKIPAVRDVVLQRKDVVGYADAPNPKAIALHPRGVLAVVTAAASQRRAETQALKACNDDDSSRDADGPCFLYASGDEVVLPRRATVALAPKP